MAPRRGAPPDNAAAGLSERDLAILKTVVEFRGCTSAQLHARHWDPSSSLSACYRRLAFLIVNGYLHSFRLPSVSGVGSGKRILTLGRRGRELFAAGDGLISPNARDVQIRAPLFAAHHEAINDFRLTLELSVRQLPGVELDEWIDEARLRTTPIRVDVKVGNKLRREVTIVPDGAFGLARESREQRFFLEMDMDTIPLHRLRWKVRGYLAYQRGDTIPALVVVPTPKRLHDIAKLISGESGRRTTISSAFFLALRSSIVCPGLLCDRIWTQVGVSDPQAILPDASRRSAIGAPHNLLAS